MRTRAATFRVSTSFDRADGASLRIEPRGSAGELVAAVRLHRRRRVVELPLAALVEIILERDAKLRAAERATARRRRIRS